jgi:hypothetical protein
MSKLQKYARYIELPWKEKLRLVESAQALPPNSSLPYERKSFEE